MVECRLVGFGLLSVGQRDLSEGVGDSLQQNDDNTDLSKDNYNSYMFYYKRSFVYHDSFLGNCVKHYEFKVLKVINLSKDIPNQQRNGLWRDRIDTDIMKGEC